MTITHNPNNINTSEWNELALSSTLSSAFQTFESYLLYASCSEFQPFFTALTDDNNRLKGIVCGAVHSNGPFPFSLLTRRAIVFGGPLLAEDITGDELLALLQATTAFLRRKAIYLEFRFTEDYSHFHSIFIQAGINIYPALDAIIDTSSHESIIRNIQKRKRRQIRAALRNNIETIENPSKEEIASFYPILRNIHWRVSHKPIPSLDFFLKLSDSPIGYVSLLRYDTEIVALNAAFILPRRKFYHMYSVGRDSSYTFLDPSSVALYTLLHTAADRNIPLCDLMGAGVPNKPYGVRDFKIRMGAETPDYKRARYLFCPIIYKLLSLLFH